VNAENLSDGLARFAVRNGLHRLGSAAFEFVSGSNGLLIHRRACAL